ncbi:hypothetical protein ACQX6Q_20140 [Salmonella enterica]|uniref:hypothetical protein n=1 Tax=Salmonella enterica TaxID=28901 RepID=UPI000F9F210A|nr:hypothetical protein [Salmonella enterica subsp. enterica serovar Napoli]MLQ56558.1 hypothetical protein [Salmonella enterica subsp. enterica serovar Napoli]
MKLNRYFLLRVLLLITTTPAIASLAREETAPVIGHMPTANPRLFVKNDTLSVDYKFNDIDGDSEKGTTFQWQGKTATGWQDIPGQTEKIFTGKNLDNIKLLRVNVTPRTNEQTTYPFEGKDISSDEVNPDTLVSETKSSITDCKGLAGSEFKCNIRLITIFGTPVKNVMVDIHPSYPATTVAHQTDNEGHTVISITPSGNVDAADDDSAKASITVDNIKIIPHIMTRVTPVIRLYDKINKIGRDWSGLVKHGAYLPINSSVGFSTIDGAVLEKGRWSVIPTGFQLDSTGVAIKVTNKAGATTQGTLIFEDKFTGIKQETQQFRITSYILAPASTISIYGGIKSNCRQAGASEGFARDNSSYNYVGLNEGSLWAGVEYSDITWDGGYSWGKGSHYISAQRITGKHAENARSTVEVYKHPNWFRGSIICR